MVCSELKCFSSTLEVVGRLNGLVSFTNCYRKQRRNERVIAGGGGSLTLLFFDEIISDYVKKTELITLD